MSQVRDTSQSAYNDIRDNGTVGRQAQAIADFVRASGRDWSLRELEQAMGLRVNVVSGRCNDLKKAGMLLEAPERKCSVSGRVIHPIQAPRSGAQLRLV